MSGPDLGSILPTAIIPKAGYARLAMGLLSHEEVVEAMQETLDKNPGAMGMRRETVDFPHDQNVDGSPAFLDEDAAKVAAEMGLHVLVYNAKPRMAALGRNAP
jgi:hypothetical protein